MHVVVVVMVTFHADVGRPADALREGMYYHLCQCTDGFDEFVDSQEPNVALGG